MRFDLTVRVSKKSEFFWNLLGSIANASTTVIMLAAATQIVGVKEAGIFSLAAANAQLLVTIGNFGVRPYQSTDLTEKFSFDVYYTHRIMTCLAMILSCVCYCIFSQSDGEKSAVIILYTVLRASDAFADVFEGYMQQLNRLDLAGCSLFFRTLLYSAVYSACLYITHDISISIIAAIGTAVLCLYKMQYVPVRKYRKQIRIDRNIHSFCQVTKECCPLFFSLFMMMYFINAPKYAIDRFMPSEEQAYYNIIYMPAQVINLMSSFVFKPLLTQIADDWNDNIEKMTGYIHRFYLYILGITICSIGAAAVAGIPVLSFVYGVDLSHLKLELLVILAGGGFNALANMLYYILTAMRMQKNIMISYLVVTAAALMIPNQLVTQLGLMGAVYAYVLFMCMLAVWMSVSMYRGIYKKKCCCRR